MSLGPSPMVGTLVRAGGTVLIGRPFFELRAEPTCASSLGVLSLKTSPTPALLSCENS